MVKVSVIVPVYNVESYLKKSIHSLLAQTLDDIEFIFINDGSTDGSKAILDKYQELYPNKIKTVSIENGGAANARNIGLKMATGEYIGFIDSDDYVDKSMFEKMYNLAVESDSEIVTCGYYRIDYKDIQRRDCANRRCFGKSVYQAPELFINNVPYIWNKLFKKDLIDRSGIEFDTNLRIFEDLVFTFKLFTQANRISRVCEPLYNYIYSRSQSLTFTFSEKRFDLFSAFDSLIYYFKKNNCFYHFEEELLFILTNHIYVVCGGEIEYSKIPLLYDFIDYSFDYMSVNFPFWKDYTTYYNKYKKNKFLFTKKLYWKSKALLPKHLKHFRKPINVLKRALPYNKTGAYYLKSCKTDVVANRVLINSQHGANLNGNMFYILKELCNNSEYSDFEIGIAYKKDNKTIHALLEEYGFNRDNVKLLITNSHDYAEYLATAKYLFNDTSFPVYFSKREDQVYLNTWHGTPLKTLGRSTAQDYYDIANLQKNFIEADYILYPSDYMEGHMLRDYMLSDIANNKILKCGYPRNEIFFDKQRENEIRSKYGLTDKQIIAYMPTWRGNVRNVTTNKSDVISYLEQLDLLLRDDQHLFVNLHPYDAKQWVDGNYRHISKFPSEIETYDFLNACDMLITDYSSVFFDYAISGKKIILFAYDEEQYFANRGLYMPFNDLPFTKVTTVEDLLKEIDNPSMPDINPFLNQYCYYDSADISKQILDMMILNKDNDLVITDLHEDKDKMMVSLNDFRDLLTVERVTELLSDQPRINTYFTYNTKELRDQAFFKALPRSYQYFGKLNADCLNSLFDSLLITLMETKPWVYKVFKNRILDSISREYKRAYPDVTFRQWTILGQETFKAYLTALNECEHSVVYISEESDFNPLVPLDVYKAFDSVIFESEELKDKINYNGENSIVRSISSLDDLYID